MFKPPTPARLLHPLAAAAILLMLSLASLPGAHAQAAGRPRPEKIASPQVQAADGQHWVTTWAAPMSSPTNNGFASAISGVGVVPSQYSNQTLRLNLHTSIGGNSARIRVSNVFGTQPLNIGAAHIALRSGGANIVAGTDRTLTFSGQPTVSIPAGALILSDPVDLAVPQFGALAVSLYLPDPVTLINNVQPFARQLSYVTVMNGGDATGATIFPVGSSGEVCPFLTAVEVLAPASAPLYAAIGDSLTEGDRSTSNLNRRWTDFFKRRLYAQNKLAGIANLGISGDQLLIDRFGPSVLSRFDPDILAQPGLTHAVVLIGLNDVGMNNASAASLIAGHRQLIARAHDRGIKVIGGVFNPVNFGVGSTQENTRAEFNRFMRECAEYDGIIDFDAAVRDPNNPTALLPAFNSGDNLHPNDAGYEAMGNAVDLTLFNGFVTLNSVVSRKTHANGAGIFDLPLPQTFGAAPAIESRGGGANGGDYTLVFSFAAPVTAMLGAHVCESVGSVASMATDPGDASKLIVNLSGVTSGQYVTVALTNVSDGVNTSSVRASFGVLVGDVGNNATVNAADIAQVKSLSGQGVNANNYRADLNLDGVINAADVAFAKSRSGSGLPATPIITP